MSWKTLKLLYRKFISDSVYQILSELTWFCGRYDKNILVCFFGSQCIIRSHHIVVGGLKFYCDSSSSTCFFLSSHSTVRARWTELNQNWIMLGRECDLKMYVRNLGYPVAYKSGAQNHLCRRLRNLTANSTAFIFRTKHETHNRANALQTTRDLLRRLKMSWTLVDKRLKLDRQFYPPP